MVDEIEDILQEIEVIEQITDEDEVELLHFVLERVCDEVANE
jgi:hypothetical protein